MISRISVRHVRSIPDVLEPGVLYVSKEFETAHHLCACGCGARVRTPLGKTDWQLRESRKGASLWPSIGNWQKGCQSHYVIRDGTIYWAERWSPEEIAAGRAREQLRREAYFAQRASGGWIRKIGDWLSDWLGR